jgi:spermidine synthase
MQRKLLFALAALGFSSIITQVLLLREFLNVFSGNELVIGIILANWMLLTGIGSYVANLFEPGRRQLIILQSMVAVLPFLEILSVRFLRVIAFEPGVMVGLQGIMVSSFAILLPYCLVNGYIFSIASRILKGKEAIGRAYSFDSLGMLVGGCAFSFVLIFFLNAFQIVAILFAMNMTAVVMLSSVRKEPRVPIIIVIALVFLAGFFGGKWLDLKSTEFLFPQQELVKVEDSRYGRIVVTNTAGQANVFEDGMLLYSENDTMAAETVHYAMAQNPKAKSVLVVSGWMPAISQELMKYNLSIIDYVELDPLLVRLQQFSPKVRAIAADARQYIRQQHGRYDTIILNLPDPQSAQLNRLYTIEFFREAKRALTANGIMMTSSSASEDYMSPEERRLNAALYTTLKKAFSHILVIPGDRNYFLASDAELTYDIAARLKDIETKYVNKYYLAGQLTQDRIDYVDRAVTAPAQVNQDFKPIAYSYYFQYWLRHFGFNVFFAVMAIGVLLLLYLTRLKAIEFTIFTTGFFASAVEIIAIISFQIVYGNAYYQIGIIVTLFMAGAATGSYLLSRTRGTKIGLQHIERMIVAYLAAFALILFGLSTFTVSSQLVAAMFLLLAFTAGLLAGAQFSLATGMAKASIAKHLYTADLVGASLGALLVSATLIPWLGLINVLWLVAILKLVSMAILRSHA